MGPHPRIRKTVKWAGIAVTALFLSLWIACASWLFVFESKTGDWVNAGCGKVKVWHWWRNRFHTRPTTTWYAGRNNYLPLQWGFDWNGDDFYSCWTIPLWFPASISCAITLNAWRLDTVARRRASANACPTCGYPRVGLPPTALCPECGPLGKG